MDSDRTKISPDSNFTQEKVCTYKGEQYAVRDNGAILRLPKNADKPRPKDNQWTFGNINDRNGYMEFINERVHRIVAFAFLGEPPTTQHIIDHIDTNRQNNRPNNLRWVTKLENALNNPITRKKIILLCGSIENFLANPAMIRESELEPEIRWMRTVTPQEAKISKERLLAWAENDKVPTGKGTLGEWIYQGTIAGNEQQIDEIFKKVEQQTRISRKNLTANKAMRGNYYEARKYAAKLLRIELNLSDYDIGKLLGLSATTVNLYLEVCADMYSGDCKEIYEKQYAKMSEQSEFIPKNVIQKNWGTQSDYPCCPQQIGKNPLAEYLANLQAGKIFFQNPYYFTIVLKVASINEDKSLLVLYEVINQQNTDKRWGIIKITFENGKFAHELIYNYNGTQQHYWLIDAENHFQSIIEKTEWMPLYDSQGKKFEGDYMPL